MKTFAFVDASNLFYGGEKSLGWKIDYQRLLTYLKEKYQTEKVLYFGGIEIHNYHHDYLQSDSVDVVAVEKHLVELLKNEKHLDEASIMLMGRHLKRVRFYKKLEEFGFDLFLKPVKMYELEDGSTKRKANCDVDMAFCLMKEQGNFDRVAILSGDGDFLPVLKHLRGLGKEVIVLARGPRTAKEIRQFAASNFRDFEYLETKISFEK